jgi:hypothetical protein
MQCTKSQVMTHLPRRKRALLIHEYGSVVCIRTATLQLGVAHDGENVRVLTGVPAIENENYLRTRCLERNEKVPYLAAKLR